MCNISSISFGKSYTGSGRYFGDGNITSFFQGPLDSLAMLSIWWANAVPSTENEAFPTEDTNCKMLCL